MPRKMYRNPEAEPTPTPAERPGSGTPKEEARKRLHRDHKDEPSFEIEPEYLKAIERVEKAEPSVIVERESPAKKREGLLAERADLEERMEKLGGVWGGEKYFELNDQLSEINRMLDAEAGADRSKKRTKRETPTAVVEEDVVMGELTPEDHIADARKTLKFIEDSEKEIAARQKKLQKELSKHGLKTPARVAEELSKIEDELREEATGTKPDFWGRIKSVGRRLAGMEPSSETKELLKKYVDLEQQMNAQIHARAEAEAQMVHAEKNAGRTRRSSHVSQAQMRSLTRQPNAPLEDSGFSPSDIPAMAKTFMEAQEMHRGSKEVQVTLALKEIEEEIRGALGEMASMQELTETELNEEMFEEKKTNFAKRIRALEEQGKSEAFDEALEEAEEALMRYVMAVHQRRQTFIEEARTAGKGEARPASVVGIRSGRAGGAYAPKTSDRRIVSMSRMETADSREERVAAERRDAAAAPERVNKEVEMYRSVKWRKNLIDRVNTDENARRAMHGVYEAFKHRMLEKLANEEEVDFRTGSPDPALDYALNLYRKYARRTDGKGYVYDLKIRHAAHEELEEIESVLGKNWDKNGWAAQAVRAVSQGKVKLATEESYEAFREIEPEDEDVIAEVIPLPHVKRALSEQEQEDLEELEIPVTVEEPVVAQERPLISAEAAEKEMLERAGEQQRKIDEEAERSFETALSGFRPAEEALAEAEEAAPARPAMEESEFGYQGASTSEPERGIRRSRRKAGVKESPRSKVEAYGPLTEMELAYLKESLNRRMLALGPTWEKVGPEVKRLLAAKHGWVEEYALMYQQYREGKSQKSMRRALDRVNELMGIEKPIDLLVPPSPQLRERIAREIERVERAFAAAEEKPKKTKKTPQAAPKAPTPQVLTMAQLQENIARKKAPGDHKEPTGIPPTLAETPSPNVRSLDEARKNRKKRKK